MPSPASNLNKRLLALQEHLGVKADGIIGPVSITTLENALDIQPPANTFNLTVSKISIDALFRYEISSEAYYTKFLQKPVWPGGDSGVTIGIGYDLGFSTKDGIIKDWGDFIPEDDLNILVKVAELTGGAAKQALSQVKDISVPLTAAKNVFFQITLPQFAKLTKQTYPGTENLFADAQGVMVSLIYNRGSSLANNDRRKEMKAIKPLVAAADYTGIADQLRQMKRLWDPAKAGGLINRREDEAKMLKNADRQYSNEELVRI